MATKKKSLPVKRSIVAIVEELWNKKTNEQQMFISPHGVIYYWFVQMENGDRGKYGSLEKYQSKFKTGKEVFYTCELRTSGKFPERIIKPHEPVTEKTLNANINNKSKDNNKEKPMTPKEIKQLCKNLSIHNATISHIALKKTPSSKEALAGLAEKYYKWCMNTETKTREVIEARAKSIELAIENMINFPTFPLKEGQEGIKTSDDVLELASYYFYYSTTE